jgi:hypothetical protein
LHWGKAIGVRLFATPDGGRCGCYLALQMGAVRICVVRSGWCQGGDPNWAKGCDVDRRFVVYRDTVGVVVVEVDEVDVVDGMVVGVMSSRVSTAATVVPMLSAMSAALMPWLLSCWIWAL